MPIATAKPRLRLPWILLLVVLTSSLAAPVTASLLEEAFAPLRDLDIPRFYSQYSSVIDAIIFLVIFVGLAQVTLGKRFGSSRGAKALVAGVGIALALALVIMERTMDFSIAQFGPYAAAILVILAASVLFYLLRILGVGGITSFSTSYVIVYFLLRAVVPSFFHWVQARAPGLHGLIALGALICLVAALWTLVAAFWPGNGKLGRLAERIRSAPEAPAEGRMERTGLGAEMRLLKGEMAEIQRQRVKDSEAIVADLDSILAVIDRHGDTAEARRLIGEKLSQDIAPREHRLRTSLRALRKLYERVERFELGMLAQLKRQPPAKRKAAEDAIKAKLQKLNIEARIRKLEERMEEHDRFFRSRLSQAVEEVNAGRMDRARSLLADARDAEMRIRELDEESQKLGMLLRGLASREVVKGATA